LDWCRKLGADIAVNYNSDDFGAVVKEATEGEGVDIVFDTVGEVAMEKSLGAIAYNGRYIMMGFSSNKTVADEKFLVPRRLALSNISLCAVMLAYADEAMSDFLKDGMGWNFVPAALGEKINREIISLVQQGKIKPAIGQVVDFEDIPQTLQDLADRKTVGKIIATL
jgi:NADPH2:quinone reductase